MCLKLLTLAESFLKSLGVKSSVLTSFIDFLTSGLVFVKYC